MSLRRRSCIKVSFVLTRAGHFLYTIIIIYLYKVTSKYYFKKDYYGSGLDLNQYPTAWCLML